MSGTLNKEQIEFLWEDVQGLLPLLEPLAGDTVILTGCNGFIGSYFMDLFARHNMISNRKIRVVGVDNLTVNGTGRLHHLQNDFTKPHNRIGIEHRDLADLNNNAYLPKTHWVIHAASIASPALYKTLPLATIDVNVNGTWNVLRRTELMDFRGMLHFSSSEIYGTANIIPTPETEWGSVATLGSRACYDESKRLSETLCWIYAQDDGVPVKIVRPFNIYGPGMNLNDGRVIPSLIKSIANGRDFEVHGDGTATRSYCYISDAVAQFLSVLVNGVPGEAYNVGNDEMECSLNDLVRIAHETFDGRPNVRYVPAVDQLRDAPTRRQPDLTKVLQIAPKPKVMMKQGLERSLIFHGNG
jgi:UDP-glucuronate decarboxylase